MIVGERFLVVDQERSLVAGLHAVRAGDIRGRGAPAVGGGEMAVPVHRAVGQVGDVALLLEHANQSAGGIAVDELPADVGLPALASAPAAAILPIAALEQQT